jgi:hypothetical protein
MKFFSANLLFIGFVLACGGVSFAAQRQTSAALESPRILRLTNAEQRRLNTYFSNFSEVFVEPFERGKITDKALIEFGVRHNLTNNNRLWTKKGLAAHYVDESARKFFGRGISQHHAPSEIYPFKEGYYGLPTATGEGIAFSQVTGWRSLGKNEYRANITIYIASNGWEGDRQAAMAAWRRNDSADMPRVFQRMIATVRKETSGKKSRYILLDYREVKK